MRKIESSGNTECATWFSSRGEDDFAEKVLSALRYQFGGHEEKAAAQKEGV